MGLDWVRRFFPPNKCGYKSIGCGTLRRKGEKPAAVFDKRGLELRPHLQQQGVYGGACRAQVHIQV